MKGFAKFLAFYSLIITTVLLVGSSFFLPTPQGYIIAASLVPMTIYFWITATDPASVSANKWSLRLVFSVIIIGVLGVFGYWLSEFAPQPQQSDQQAQIEQILSEVKTNNKSDYQKIIDQLEELSYEVNSSKTNDNSSDEVLSLTTQSPEEDLVDLVEQNYLEKKGEITINSKVWNSIDVYEKASGSSNIIGSIDYGKNYPYFKKEGDYYLIELPDDTQGYVKVAFVEEVK
jgi:hypothetical protein